MVIFISTIFTVTFFYFAIKKDRKDYFDYYNK